MLCFPGRKNAAVCDNVTLRDGGSVQGSHCIIIPVTAVVKLFGLHMLLDYISKSSCSRSISENSGICSPKCAIRSVK